MKKPTTRSFTITIEDAPGGALTTISPGDGLPSHELFEGLVSGISAFYVAVWGSEDVVPDEHLDPEEFAQMVYAKILIRLEDARMTKATVQ